MFWTSVSMLVSLIGCADGPINRFTSVPTTGGPVVYAWGNSQTQGYGLAGCETPTCHAATAWPQFFANAMGWTLDNQAYGGSNCADLTYRGTSLSLWDLPISSESINIYGHFRNDQAGYGPLPYRVAFVRGCIEAQTAWLAIPESEKVRANGGNVLDKGTWMKGTQNSTDSYSLSAGTSKTFVVSGKSVYLVTARMLNGIPTRYTVSVDGNLVEDTISQSAVFTQELDVAGQPGLPVNEDVIQNFIRVSGLANTPHTIVYTCADPGSTGCHVFYAAGNNPDNLMGGRPVVYSLSPIYNQFKHRTGSMNSATTSLYHDEWVRMVSELDGDGLQVIGIDATDLDVYNSLTETQSDGIHPNLTGHISIATGATKAATAIGRQF
jgi:lysophospholipase L1-like esterase